MIHYRDVTFCRGDGCAVFSTCPRALTKEVIDSAKRWWNGNNPPIAQFSNPKELECYISPEHKKIMDIAKKVMRDRASLFERLAKYDRGK